MEAIRGRTTSRNQCRDTAEAPGGGGSYNYYNNASSYSNSSVLPGGPSPVGSHNTPSPQAHSEDGDEPLGGGGVIGGQPQQQQPPLHHLNRNNNILKRPPPSSALPPGQSMENYPPSVVPKKPKVSKRKKKRDPNEPQKPVSAYALFFRDSQASIKVANPSAAFGDVSKIVASLWDSLDVDSKNAYKKRTENAKKDYLKKLAAYRASLVSKGSTTPGITENNPYYSGTTSGGGGAGNSYPYSASVAANGYSGQPNHPFQSSYIQVSSIYNIYTVISQINIFVIFILTQLNYFYPIAFYYR